MSTTEDTNAARRGSGSNDLLGLLARLQSLKVLLGTDSPEVRGWAPVVQQGAQATVNAAIAEIKSAADRVADERERCARICERQHDMARTSTGAARASACADAIRKA